MSVFNLQNNKGNDEGIGLKKAIAFYMRKWKWFAFSVFITLLFALIYLRYTTPEYQSNGLIRFVTLNNNPTPEEAILGELGLVYGGDKLHTDEIQILKSWSLLEEAIKNLKYNIQVFSEGKIKDVELYNSNPVTINLLAEDSLIYDLNLYFEIDILSESDFVFTDEYGIKKSMVFGSSIPFDIGSIIITPSEKFDIDKYRGRKLKVLIEPITEVAERYREKLNVYSFNDRVNRSNMIGLSITDPVPEKAAYFINEVIKIYNQRSIDNKNEVAESTFNFINNRITDIASDLNAVDSDKESFKVGNMLTDVNTEAGMYVEAEAINEAEMRKVGIELDRVNYMIGFMQNITDQTYDLLPINIGFDDNGISNMTTKYNELVLERNRILGSSGPKNPVVQQLDDRLNSLLLSLKQSLDNLKNALLIRQNNLRSQSATINSKIASVPRQERENRNIQRQQNIKESIYLYLLQKREEAAISMVTAYPSAEIIDHAMVDNVPVTPKKKFILLLAMIFGLLIPFAILFLKNLLDTKINTRQDLEIIQGQLKVIGELPKIKDPDNLSEKDSAFTEALRLIRTNLTFKLSKIPGHTKTIFITSSVNGEGKSFLAYHLSRVYAYTNNRVLLIGADIRRPNLQTHLKVTNRFGLSDYLKGEASKEDVLNAVDDIENLFFLHSGSIPTNPAELLMSNKVGELLNDLKGEFDIIIVDTAPTMMVTDTMLIGNHADHTLYVVRSGYTDKETLTHVKELHDENKLVNISLVLNDVKSEYYSYKSKYGYNYSPIETLPLHKKILQKIGLYKS